MLGRMVGRISIVGIVLSLLMPSIANAQTTQTITLDSQADFQSAIASYGLDTTTTAGNIQISDLSTARSTTRYS